MRKKRGRPAKKVNAAGIELPDHKPDPTQYKKINTEEALNSGPTPEDMELERRLRAIDAEEIVNEPQIERDPNQVRKSVREPNTLTLLEGQKPPESLSQLRDQVFMAEQSECDAIEVAPNIMKAFLKNDYERTKNTSGYLMYSNIRLYEAGTFEDKKDWDFRTVDDVMGFNNKK